MTTYTINDNHVSRPRNLGAGQIVTVTPAAGAYAVFEYTTDDSAAVSNGVATWYRSPRGDATVPTSYKFDCATIYRVSPVGGAATYVHDEKPSAAALAAYADIEGVIKVTPPRPATITLQEGKALTLTGSAGAVGVAYLLDQVLGGTNSVKSWAVGAGMLAPIGPYSGTQKILLTCTAGSIDATVGDAVLNAVATAANGSIKGIGPAAGTFLPLLSARLATNNLAAHIPMQPNFSANERGSVGTYHTTLEISGDVAYVQPIILVTRDPSDATYTSDDTYNYIGVAPTAALLDANGQPNPTGGNSAWVTSAAAVFPRKAGASISNPIPVAGPIIPVSTIPRTDGGNGRLLMLRAYSQGGSYPSIGATTRMPVYTSSVADQALWDSYNPLVGQHKFYYANGDYVSANQSNFSSIGTPATRWANSCIVGAKCMFTQPHVSILIAGDSIMAGAHAQTGVPTFYGFAARAVELLRAAGYLADLTNCAVSGYSWDQFTPIANMVMPIIKPDVVIIPSYTPNGVDVGHTTGTGNTVSDALLHWGKCLTLRDNALAAGAKTVMIMTPCPFGATGSPTNPVPRALIRQWVIASGMPYVDMFPYAGPDYGYNQAYRFDDQTHPNDAMNAGLAVTVASSVSSLIPL